MKVIQKGEGDPEHAVMGCVHGDEPAGKKAIEKIIRSEYEFRKPIKFVIANEKALEQNERFLDVDLNRCFPGDPQSNHHEERLAAKLVEELRGLKLLDIHSTRSEPVPFGLIHSLSDNVIDSVCNSGIKRACYFDNEADTVGNQFGGLGFEVGPQGTEEAAEMAYKILVNYLAAVEVIDANFKRSDPDIFEYYETVEGGNWEFLGENFEKVEKGEVFARHGTTELISTEDFYPVLMSTDGYETILGQKARKLEKPTERD